MFLGSPRLGAIQASLPGCGGLCGSWQVNVAASDAPAAVVDKAFVNFKEPRPKRGRGHSSSNVDSVMLAEDEASLGPILDRPPRTALQDEINEALKPPQLLVLGAAGRDILIESDGRSSLRLTPNEPHSRVDGLGTAKIRTTWRGDQLVVSETYDRRHRHTRSYTLQRGANTLVVTQVITRPGLRSITLRSVYDRN
jgi:hypothetical protein